MKAYIFLCLISFAGFILSCNTEEIKPDEQYTGILPVHFNPDLDYGTMKDQSSIEYKTIQIGNQVWMAENLRTLKFRNGDSIEQVTVDSNWGKLTDAGYCNYSNTNNNDTIAAFGRLYNWYAVNDPRGLAPDGWHIPSIDEWNELINFLGRGDDELAANKMFETTNHHWKGNNTATSNQSGFTALPTGFRYGYGIGDFRDQGFSGYCWTSSQYNACGWYRDSTTSENYILLNFLTGISAQFGLSVRCIKNK